jgi:hypothetical protein
MKLSGVFEPERKKRAALIFVDISSSIKDQQFHWLLKNKLEKLCTNFSMGDLIRVHAISGIAKNDTPIVEIELQSPTMGGVSTDDLIRFAHERLNDLRMNSAYSGTCIKSSILIIQDFLKGLDGHFVPEIYYLSDMKEECPTTVDISKPSKLDTLKVVVNIPFHTDRTVLEITEEWKPFFQQYFYVDNDSLFSVTVNEDRIFTRSGL